MLSVNTNVTSLVVQNHFTLANDCVRTSLERLSTGFKINRAADDAANMAVSKNMECQISGTEVALDNVQQAINLVQTADAAMGGMQDIAQRIRELALQAANDTYSNEERKMIQQEVSSLVDEIYKQRNNAKFNEIFIFGEEELPPSATNAGDSTNSANPSVDAVSTPPLSANGANAAAVGAFDATHKVTSVDEVPEGYTAITDETEFKNMSMSGKYVLMCDIDFSKIEGWGNKSAESGFVLDGNGYAVKNLVINSSTNSDMHGLFKDIKEGATVKNLNVDNASIESTQMYIGALCGGGSNTKGTIDNCTMSGSVKGKDRTGGLVGSVAGGSITNSSASGNVTGTSNYTGGLVGYQDGGTITNSSASGSVTGTGSNTGGLVGYSRDTITNSTASGSVTGNGASTGGLVGMSSASIANSSASGNVTGTNQTGGLVGWLSGSITNSSASGNVTGTSSYIGGLVGYAQGAITQSYATGDVKGNKYIGGLTGLNYTSISDSYSLGNAEGTDDCVGGAVGENRGTLEKCYSTGTVTGSGTHVGGFAGDVANGSNSNKITDCYTTNQELDFYGANTKGGNVSGCHGANDQTGVTGHEPEWFENGENLTFLGDKFNTDVIPPDLVNNPRPVPPPPPPPPPTGEGIQFQIGANSGEENTLTINTNFSLNGFDADVTTREDALETVDKVDALIGEFSTMRSALGAAQNRLESVMDSLTTKNNNLSASHSTIVDTDFALESANLVKAQILQNATAALLAQANTAPDIALRLLQ